jgi:hypothetical protein
MILAFILGIGLLMLLYILLLLLLSVIGIVLFIIGTIKLIKIIRNKKHYAKNKKILFLSLSIIVIVAGIFLQLPLLRTAHEFVLKTNLNNAIYIETGTTVYWEEEKVDSYHTFFFNNRKYVSFDQFSFDIEKDEPVANIKYDVTEKRKKWESTSLGRILGFWKGEVIYTVKNSNDFSLLAVGGHDPASTLLKLFCDADLRHEKSQFYRDRDNYDSFISKTYDTFHHPDGYEIVVRPLSKIDYNVLNNIRFSYRDENIDISRKKKYQYINIFDISHDKVMKIFRKDFLVDNDTIYKYEIKDAYNYRGTPLDNEQISYIYSLVDLSWEPLDTVEK